VPIRDDSGAGNARRTARRLAEESGLPEEDTERAALLATEMAQNIVKYAPEGGQLLINRLEPLGTIDLIALDRAGGISDIAASFRDGFSTSGTSGTGLGAIRRQADFS